MHIIVKKNKLIFRKSKANG